MVLIEAQVLLKTQFTDTTFCALLRPDQNKVDNFEQEKTYSEIKQVLFRFFGAQGPNINPTYVETLTC